MKLLRRKNEQSSGGGGMSNAEIRHLKALSLLQEMSLNDGHDDHDSERQSLHPKRLLCFSNKPKKDQYPDERRDQSPWRSQSIMDNKTRRKKGDLSAMCNELCDDYYEMRKKLRQRPHAATAKKTLLVEAISAKSPSTTSSSVDAQPRKFDRGMKKRTNSNLHYSNESRELQRRQRSLMDDNVSVQSEQIKSKTNWNKKKLKTRRPRPSTSSRPKSYNSSKNSKSSSHGSNSRQSSSKSSYREKEIPSKSLSMSTYTEDTLPVSVVEQKKIHNNVSTISTMTSRSSYTTCDDASIILSPRAAKEKVKNQSAPSRLNLSFGCTPATPCTQPQPKLRNYTTTNSRKANVPNTDLGVIREDYDYSSSSGSLASSASFSSYGSSYSSGSYTDYSGSGTEYHDDPSLFYESSHNREVISEGRMKRTGNKNARAALGHTRSTSRGRDDSRTRNLTMSYDQQRDNHYKYYYP